MLMTIAKHPKKIKIIIISIISIALAAIIFIFVKYRNTIRDAQELTAKVPLGVNLSIDEIHHTATRDGKKEWRLDADSAQYMDAKKQVLLKVLSMTFYLEDESELILTADSGVLMTASKDVVVNGNVVVKSNDAHFSTDELHYRHDQRMLYAESPVKIKGDAFQLTAESMRLDLTNNRATFKGNVMGSFSENFSL
jgi:LPS export ABC transporter protein LptC